MLVKFSRLHTFDQSVERRDELILARNHNRRLALLVLDRLSERSARLSQVRPLATKGAPAFAVERVPCCLLRCKLTSRS